MDGLVEQNAKLIKYLDRHLIYPLLDFAQTNGHYSEVEMLQAKFALLQGTNMPDHCAELYKQINNVSAAPESFADKQKAIEKELAELESQGQKVLEVLENPEVASALRQDKAQNLVFLRDSHGISSEQINVLYKLGQFDYNRGNYAGAVDHLYHFRVLSIDDRLVMNATWGKLASEILTANWEDAMSELLKLKEQIDADTDDTVLQLRNRTWLLHWALFPMHKSSSYKAVELQDLYFTPAYLNALQTSAPHLLRYLVIAVLTSSVVKGAGGTPNRRLKDLIRLLEIEKVDNDPIIAFARNIFIKYDFASLPGAYGRISDTLQADYFLQTNAEDTMKALRLVAVEAYLRLHRTTELSSLATIVEASQEELISLINDDLPHLSADVDIEDGTVEVLREQSSTLQDLVNKTKSLAQRSANTQSLIAKSIR